MYDVRMLAHVRMRICMRTGMSINSHQEVMLPGLKRGYIELSFVLRDSWHVWNGV